MQHMQKLPARSDCRNHLFVLSSSLAACVGNPKMQRVLQVGKWRSCCAERHQSHWQHQGSPVHWLMPAQCSVMEGHDLLKPLLMTPLCVYNALLLMQIAAQHPYYFIHFLQLIGPEAELQAAASAAAGGPMNQQQQQGPSTDDVFLQMLRSMPACDNITYDAFAAGV